MNTFKEKTNRRKYALTPEEKRAEYKRGYEETLSQLKNGKAILFDDKRNKNKSIWYRTGSDDAELTILRGEAGYKRNPIGEDVNRILLTTVMKMIKEKKILTHRQMDNLIKYRLDKSKEIEQLTQRFNEVSSAKNGLDQLLEGVASRLILSEKRRE